MTFQLEVRKCSNPKCTRTFKVLATSPQTACSTNCANPGMSPFELQGLRRPGATTPMKKGKAAKNEEADAFEEIDISPADEADLDTEAPDALSAKSIVDSEEGVV